MMKKGLEIRICQILVEFGRECLGPPGSDGKSSSIPAVGPYARKIVALLSEEEKGE